LLLTSAFVLLPGAGAGRIIGGQEVKPHSRPYMAYLEIKTVSENYTCGGFLIYPDAVLSAAHCVDKEGIVSITVTLGAHNIKCEERSQQKIPVRHYSIHPDYCRTTLNNDIVLLKLHPRARVNKYVRPIVLPKSNEHVRKGAECNVLGWGWTCSTPEQRCRTNVMMEVELKVQNEAICQRLHNYQPQSMICVGDKFAKKASYRGDSGGPLVCNQKAHGIVSHGHGHRLFPVVFTRISFFEPWIREQLRKFAL
ncbi:DDN1 protein, partial [Orthonyx spaldingii]|nr:DDN1 protein [Orthonyx spaldingii]